jgi:hypothetical protein
MHGARGDPSMALDQDRKAVDLELIALEPYALRRGRRWTEFPVLGPLSAMMIAHGLMVYR